MSQTSAKWHFELMIQMISYAAAHCRRITAFLSVLLCAIASHAACAESSANANSAMGINLTGVSYYTPQVPFLNLFKTNSGFATQNAAGSETNEEQYLSLDPNGWPTSLKAVNEPATQQFTRVSALILRSPSSNSVYASGQYIVLYQGQGTLSYGFDAEKNSSASTPGRDVINVANATAGGILISITSTDPNGTGNYIRDIQVVSAAQEGALAGGQMFNPTFLNLLRNFRALRFMDWFNTNGSTLSSWSNRPLPTDATWASKGGVPYEVAVQLANAVSADGWFNVPIMADDNFITQFATLVHNQLGTSQNAYVELSNEVWNSGFSQFAYANAQGRAMWPNAGSGADYGNNWYGMRVAQMCDIWKRAWGADSTRVLCVMGAQAAVPWTATEALNCALWTGTGNAPCSSHGIGAVAIAPYFGGTAPSSWTSQPDGGLTSLFAAMTSQNDPGVPSGGFLGQALGWVAAYGPALAAYKLPLIAYESGQSFVSFPHGVNSDGTNNALTNLYINANRDPRMQSAYQSYLQGWKSNGGELIMHYNDIGQYGQYGEWGALESITQTTNPLTSAPPKWQALQGFIAGTPCWWAGCAGSVGSNASPAVPMAPTSLSVR
jgi:hypothetical protein